MVYDAPMEEPEYEVEYCDDGVMVSFDGWREEIYWVATEEGIPELIRIRGEL